MLPQNQQVSSIGPVAGPSGSGRRGQYTTDMPLHPSTSHLDLARPYDRDSYHSVHIEGPHDGREPITEQTKPSEDVAEHTTRRQRGMGAEGSRQAQDVEEPSVPPQSQPSTSADSTAVPSGSGLHGKCITDRTSSSDSSTATRSDKARQRPHDDRGSPHVRSPEASSRHLTDLTNTPRAGPSLTRSVVWPARSPETSTRHLADITNTPRAGPPLNRSVIWPSFPLPPYHGPHQYSFSGYGYPGAGYGTNLAPHHESSGMHQSSYYGYSSHYYPNFDHNRISGREWVDHGHSLDDDSTPSRSRRGTLEDASYSPTPRPDGHMPLPFHRESTAVSTVAYLPLSSDRSSNESHIHDRLAGRSEGIPTGQRTQPSIAAMPQSDGPIHLPVGVRGRRDTYTPLPSFSSLVSSVPSLEEPRLSGNLSVPESRPTIPSRSQVAAPALSEDIDPEIVAARTLMDIRRVHFGNLNGENASGSQTQSRAIGSSRRRRGPYDRPPPTREPEHGRGARPSRERPSSTRKRSSRR
ncbi:hypothetical protein K474DRAFT_819720 [Panus rudis PR-1116 ss-1]|nr:hypothetical protein K474DRAFT_819720 [Panus rudis PR-1116 ss-1]